MTTIKLTYRSSDGFTETKTFKTLEGAQKYAHRMIGSTPELAASYAVSGDGVGTIKNVRGCSMAELFPDAATFDSCDALSEAEYNDPDWCYSAGNPEYETYLKEFD